MKMAGRRLALLDQIFLTRIIRIISFENILYCRKLYQHKKLIITNLIIFLFFLEGCNTTQKIVSTGKNTYMVSSWVPFGARPRAEFNATTKDVR